MKAVERLHGRVQPSPAVVVKKFVRKFPVPFARRGVVFSTRPSAVQCLVTSGVNVAYRIMTVRTRFGLWTLFAAVAWIAGLIMAGVVIWRLWTDWYPR